MCEIARSQAALMANFVKFKRLRRLNLASFAMRAAWLRLVRTQVPLGTITTLSSERINGHFLGCFFKKTVKTAVPEDGSPPGALVLAKEVEWYRFGVGDEKSFLGFVSVGKQIIARVG